MCIFRGNGEQEESGETERNESLFYVFQEGKMICETELTLGMLSYLGEKRNPKAI